MSTAMNFGNKSFTPRPPDKGAFPLDHLGTQNETGRVHCLDIVIPGECKKFKEVFMECLKDNRYDSSMCRMQSKNYLECRMERQLMAKEPLEKLGFKDLLNQSGEEPKH